MNRLKLGFYTALIICWNALLIAVAEKPETLQVISGPMLGYIEHQEALIWIETGCARKVSLRYFLDDNPKYTSTLVQQNPYADPCQPFISKFVLPDLRPGEYYRYEISLDDQSQNFHYPLIFKTKSKHNQYPEYSFLTGSCNYVNEYADESFGQGTNIFNYMANTKADFMLWLGDNTYLRPADYTSESGIRHRYSHTRADPNLQRFLASMSHYAIWDDHDYGPNDSNMSYELKEIARKYFIEYWANQVFGEYGKGIYSKFRYYDSEFFLLDDRSFRDENNLDSDLNPDKSLLGDQQMRWLKNALAGSQATFKFIALGSQFLNENTTKESYNYYQPEREELLDFIAKNKIKGIIFLTGDRHHSELIRKTGETKSGKRLFYSLYDLTSSPISSRPNKDLLKSIEKDNSMRVPDTLVIDQNFCQIKVLGKKETRFLELKCTTKDNRIAWTYQIRKSELGYEE
ncbi:MAG: alkaline phosphatase D family protein [Candidatus Caenarcaniphilales bacterium]|nr:alkaline phosphatase D family protein [Candidatus Caenarcaniphilales bacterium]